MKIISTEHLLSLPWLTALVALVFLGISPESFFLQSLVVATVKVCLVVTLTWLADRSLFWSSRPDVAAKEGNHLPGIRRAVIFVGLCHLMSLI